MEFNSGFKGLKTGLIYSNLGTHPPVMYYIDNPLYLIPYAFGRRCSNASSNFIL